MRRLVFLAAFALLAACAREVAEPPVFIVFFHAGSIEVAPESRTIIDEAAAAVRRTHPQSIAIASGIAEKNDVRLAQPRFNAIQQALVARGVDAKLIARASLPDAKLKVGMIGDQRVEILLLAKPPS